MTFRIHPPYTLIPLCLVTATLGLGACGGKVSEMISLNSSLPDEFAVVKRKPLTVPPDFSLRPPPETQRDSMVGITDTRVTAQILLNDAADITPDTIDALSDDDFELVVRAGGAESLPDIRQIVDQESTDLIRQERTFVKNLLSIIIDPELPGTTVDNETASREVNTQILVDVAGSDPQVITSTAEDGVSIVRRQDSNDFDWGSLWPF